MNSINFKKIIPVTYEADLCVIGGSCTGVFAAVRAARLGLKVVLVEKQNSLGGVATNSLVNVWHSLYDTNFKEKVIGGLTDEIETALVKRNAGFFEENESVGLRFNSEILKIELDKLVASHKIKLYLSTFYSDIILEDNKISAVIVSNKDGLCAIKASFFIDATGDGDICKDLELKKYKFESLQPATSVFLMQGKTDNINMSELIKTHAHEFGLDENWGWSGFVPNIDSLSMRADFHVDPYNCANSDELTLAEIQGRKQADSLVRLLKTYVDEKFEIVSLCSNIGVRDSYHYETRFKANEKDLLFGKRYENAIMNGTYRIDVHHSNGKGITFKYLNGKTTTFYGTSGECEEGSWKEELNFTGETATYYQIPFDLIVQEKYSNFIPVGRMLNADQSAFGALRVMVNLNQLGEAAGVAAYEALNKQISIQKVSGKTVRDLLVSGGSIL